MRPLSHPRRRHYHSNRPTRLSARLTLTALCGAVMMLSGSASAQKAQWQAEPSSLCSRDYALAITWQQVDAAKNIADAAQRIAVLNRAADLLWPYQQDRARATFREAFDSAVKDFKEKGDEPKRVAMAMLVETPDQRFVVIRAVAKRDPAWAGELTEELLRKERQEAEEAAAKNSRGDFRTAEKLLGSALSLLPSDVDAASNFAAASLNYPAGPRLTVFLYKLSEVNKGAADQLYGRALTAYGDKPVREFLYLAAYPFGFADTGDMPVTGPYQVPAAFSPNPSLQRRFVQTLLRRARQALLTPSDEGDNYNGVPGAGHILQVLTRVEPQVRQNLPDLSGALEQARNSLLGSLPPEAQSIFLRPEGGEDPPMTVTFEEMVEAAGKESNADRRDALLVTAVLNAGQEEGLDRVADAAGKIAASNVRAQLLDWLYFSRAQGAIKGGRLDEARGIASKVTEMDQRAYLYSEIAREALRKVETRSQARDALEEIVATAAKGPDTVVTVRALLSAAYLYLQVDSGRSVSVLGEAVRRLNRIESPDFSQTLVRKIEGRDFARYAVFNTPGFDPENAFRGLAKVDFDNALALASGLTDKSLRALTTLVLADYCVQRAEQQEKAKKAPRKVKQ